MDELLSISGDIEKDKVSLQKFLEKVESWLILS